jgi:hypothetical protein
MTTAAPTPMRWGRDPGRHARGNPAQSPRWRQTLNWTVNATPLIAGDPPIARNSLYEKLVFRRPFRSINDERLARSSGRVDAKT